MKVFFLVLFLAAGFFAQDTTQATYTLTVEITGFSNDDGVAKVALCNSKENYEGDVEPFIGSDEKITDGKCIISYEKIPAGEYAIMLYHDENSDGKMNMNFLGIPSEDYAFSNNATGFMGPASWEDARFDVNGDTSISIQVD